jgi:hypothetical protein
MILTLEIEMNDRIRELAKQKAWYAGGGIVTDIAVDTIVGLIIQECAGIDFRFKVGLTSDQDYEIGQVIKEHFGVE